VVVYPQTTIIDERGEPVDQYQYALNLDEPSPVTRFRRFMLAPHRLHRNFEIFGLMRREALLRTPGHEPYAHGDRVLIARMCLLGRLRQIPRPLFWARRHVLQSMQTLPSRASGGRSWATRWLGPGPLPPPEWWNPALRHRVVFPDWNLVRQYWRSVSVAPLSWPQRAACRAALLLWLGRYWPKLARDVAFAIETVLTHAQQQEAENGSAVSLPAVTPAAAVAAGAEVSAGGTGAASHVEPGSVREISPRPLRS
jgi:hypothetical protein